MSFNKVLIANRGEIAVRVIRACREMGLKTVAVFSEADRNALHAQIADEAVCIGPAAPNKSYLNMMAIIAACDATKAQAVHPGFGFLSESADFARYCKKCGLIFVGPSCKSIEMMGDKARAKQTMTNSKVAVIPGSNGIVSDLKKAGRAAEEIGYPVMLKASAGGGGRGVRLVNSKKELENSFTASQTEALSWFGNGDVYIEKFIENPRHVEVQVIGDTHGNIVHLGERDCSIQRRNQKLIEEALCPAVDDSLRAKIGKAACRAAEGCGYHNAGTIEFLLDKDENFYFMEMNTRIQVEHGITELVTGIDLVKQQLAVAMGEKLPFTQEDVKFSGHAIECRINAENPKQDFRPSPGVITALHMPGGPGVRIDSAVYAGCEIPPYYDSMIAKLMVYAPSRTEALKKMQWALAEFIIRGIENNVDFHLNLLKDEDFASANYDIGFLQRKMGDGFA
ncbi:MAG: acetyl-CoA carboxylase biotin carboxylase subunit [Oscillospiraceae bacterium]|nr:acetyl-CoA carboxylase biotin carboxylase subunit [Oscillospiraceae bacterium]